MAWASKVINVGNMGSLIVEPKVQMLKDDDYIYELNEHVAIRNG